MTLINETVQRPTVHRRTMRSRYPAAAVAAIAAATLVTACSSSGASSAASSSTQGSSENSAAVAAPASIAKAARIVICGDASYPPELFEQNGKTMGYDADVANAIGEELGVKTELSNVPFVGVVAAMNAGKCDIIVNSFAITAARKKQMSLVMYGQYGAAYLVSKGNPKHITGTSSACGNTVGGGVGTDNINVLKTANTTTCKNNPIKIVGYPAETTGVQSVVTDKIDSYITDEPSAAYDATKNKTIVVGGVVGNTTPMGICVPLGDRTLTSAVTKAVAAMKSDGKLKAIFAKWDLPDVFPEN